MTNKFHCGRFVLDVTKPIVMGIVNLTDDSLSGDGLATDVAAAVRHALRLIDEGAAILDLGAESSRPGAITVSAEQEIQRLMPVIHALLDCGVPLSIDTTKTEVMRAMLDAGVDMINDINALRADGAMDVLAACKAGVCLMHMQGTPSTMQSAPHYADVVKEVARFLDQRVEAATAAGIPHERIVIDPGFGFGKTLEHNLALLRDLAELNRANLSILVGMSRKAMLGALTGRTASERVFAGVAAHMLAVQRGARILRTHDVAATADALSVLAAIES
ncbi:MAG: dihydropteroate synthase [Rhodocyclaceae bacterium]|nr:dihydropteroate synthase [Rhodocyclaceae bacterium]MBL0076112.1 dihydropteroate synthase [Rhodocyclaceae bacterium]MBP6108306.1 dihydropteroate synthase [Rhodocyclaceae bacterium]MBP6278154.1 dihydropteroate synthase [Rhodocyclaceae bacterium]